MAAYRQLVATTFEEPAWEERYQSRPSVWSGRPNPQLVAEVTDLTPGRALDVGSGEGADAVWLAARGWQVTAVDISSTALGRAAANAETAGVGDRIEFIHADLRDKPPAEQAYDLVSAQFMHLPAEQRRELFAGLAAAVAPGGVLLIVGHHPSDLWGAAHRMHMPDAMYTAQDVAADLDPAHWEVLTAEERARLATNPDGEDVTHHDAVLVARRR
ncbi:SAM-dependent methyltransferase [Micromonospora parva]